MNGAMRATFDQKTQTSLPHQRWVLGPLGRTIPGMAALCLAAFGLAALVPASTNLSAFFLHRQDRWLLLGMVLALAASCWRLPRRPRPLDLPQWALWALAAAIACLCYAGHQWILCGHDMSRDEQMAVFDAQIFAAGLPTQPLPALWQDHAGALNMLFMLPVSHPVAWGSAYLPVNAALRALIGLVADPALTGPLMAALGLVCLWKCARLLWPEDREAAVVAALLYVGSGQVLFAGMTSYAMPAHLALDLLWLWLFLLNKRGADLGALVVAALATGLHQPLFHPLFAAPFIVMLARDGAWPRVRLFVAGYAAICAFWLAWPTLTHGLVAGPHSETRAGADYLTRLIITLLRGGDERWADMGGNLLRFAAWQPILLLPLMAAGIALGRQDRLTVALIACVAAPVLVMALILPYQGHGFGYRYLHGVMGAAILLAVQGWRLWAARESRLRPLLLRTILAGLVLVLPAQAGLARALYAPYARIDARLRASDADYVIVGAEDARYARDLVINRPDLSNRPVRLLAEYVDDALLAALCRRGTRVAMPTDALFRPINDYFLADAEGRADARFEALSPRLEAAGCAVQRLDGF